MNSAPFTQVAVWSGVVVGPSNIEGLVEFFATEFNGTRVQYIREVETSPDLSASGMPIMGTGGRNDVLFAVHEDDIGKFAVPRLAYGMRWLDDVYGNGQGHLYPADVRELLSWDKDEHREDGSETGCVGE